MLGCHHRGSRSRSCLYDNVPTLCGTGEPTCSDGRARYAVRRTARAESDGSDPLTVRSSSARGGRFTGGQSLGISSMTVAPSSRTIRSWPAEARCPRASGSSSSGMSSSIADAGAVRRSRPEPRAAAVCAWAAAAAATPGADGGGGGVQPDRAGRRVGRSRRARARPAADGRSRCRRRPADGGPRAEAAGPRRPTGRRSPRSATATPERVADRLPQHVVAAAADEAVAGAGVGEAELQGAAVEAGDLRVLAEQDPGEAAAVLHRLQDLAATSAAPAPAPLRRRGSGGRRLRRAPERPGPPGRRAGAGRGRGAAWLAGGAVRPGTAAGRPGAGGRRGAAPRAGPAGLRRGGAGARPAGVRRGRPCGGRRGLRRLRARCRRHRRADRPPGRRGTSERASGPARTAARQGRRARGAAAGQRPPLQPVEPGLQRTARRRRRRAAAPGRRSAPAAAAARWPRASRSGRC